jgi:hypothetical protein
MTAHVDALRRIRVDSEKIQASETPPGFVVEEAAA